MKLLLLRRTANGRSAEYSQFASFLLLMEMRRLWSFVAESLNVNGAYLTKLFGLQEYNSRQYQIKSEKAFEVRNQTWLRDTLFWTFIASISAFSTAVIYWWGGRAVIEGHPSTLILRQWAHSRLQVKEGSRRGLCSVSHPICQVSIAHSHRSSTTG